MNLSLFLFLIGILGFILNRKNIILLIISIEIMLLAVTLLILISSFGFDDNIGQTFAIYIIAIAGAESVIGLSILVAYYRLKIILLYYKLFSFIKKNCTFIKIVKFLKNNTNVFFINKFGKGKGFDNVSLLSCNLQDKTKTMLGCFLLGQVCPKKIDKVNM